MKVSEVKRVYEMCIANPDFKEEIKNNPDILKNNGFGINLNAKDIELLWNGDCKKKIEDFPLLQEFNSFFNKTFIPDFQKMLNNLICSNNFVNWRQRQIKRTNMQFSKIISEKMINHIPFAIELSEGCSGKCWFCGISAKPLKGVFNYAEKNKILWKNVLLELKKIFGKAGGFGICYFGTEPFDNPDYEKFLEDFYEIFSRYPQTTTAMALKDVRRTKRFIKKFNREKSGYTRFSILSMEQLKKLYKEFSPDELRFVKLVIHIPGAVSFITRAGRCRKVNNDKFKFYEEATTVCLTGFLINMVRGSIELVSPCVPSDKWPNGYIVFDRGYFSNAEEFKEVIEGMIDRNMGLKFKDDDIVRFREDLKFEEMKDGFILSTKYMKRKYKNEPVLKSIGKMISKGNMKLKDICCSMEILSISSGYIKEFINILYNDGVLFDRVKF